MDRAEISIVDKIWSVILNKVAPVVLSLLIWFMQRTITRIEDKIDKLVVEVPVIQEQIKTLVSTDDKQDKKIDELQRIVADIPRRQQMPDGTHVYKQQ
jgi:low affinity Fe/Cu permease